jgi:chaperone modulatory protein CbpM
MTDSARVTYSLDRVAELTGLNVSRIDLFIRRDWVHPLVQDGLDEEDLARIHFISELLDRFGVNDEAIPVILHLADQLYYIRGVVRSGTRN